MSFQKFKTNSYCVGGKHYSPTNNIYGHQTYNKKNWQTNKIIKRHMYKM